MCVYSGDGPAEVPADSQHHPSDTEKRYFQMIPATSYSFPPLNLPTFLSVPRQERPHTS